MRSLKKILLIILFSVLLLKFCGYFLDKGYISYYSPFFEKMDLVFKDKAYNDIIYLGNSRANFGINPYFVDSVCKTKSYNLGFGGTDITSAVAFLQSYLGHHPAPRYVVLSYDHRIFQPRFTMELAPVYFYYSKYESVINELKRYNYRATLLKYLPDLKYCFFNDYYRTCIIKGLAGEGIGDPAKKQDIAKHLYDHRGFINYQTGPSKITEKADTSVPSILPQCTAMFDTLVKICIQNKITLVFVYPPELYNRQEVISNKRKEKETMIDSMVNEACKKNNFYNKRFDTGDLNPEDFADPEHVNIYGAKKYSIMLGNYLITIRQ